MNSSYKLPGHRAWHLRTAAAAGMALAMAAGCGGGGGGSVGGAMPDPGAAPSPNPTPSSGATKSRASADREAYWAQGAGLRSNLAHLLGPEAAAGSVAALDAGEQAWLRQSLAAAQTKRAAQAQPEAKRALAAAVQRRTVTGLQSFIFHTASASVQQPLDLSASRIEAYAPNSSGGFDLIAATARRADGTYAIAGVPEGPHWVRLGSRWVWTSEGFVDWSFDQFGRADVDFPTLATRMQVDAGNLSPWQASDSLAWVVPEQGQSSAIPLTDVSTTNAPRARDPALAAFGFELGPNGLFGGLLNAAKGDRAFLNQLVTQPATGVRVLGRAMVLAPLTTADGSTTLVNSGFLDVAANARLRLRWDRSAFAAAADAVHPGVTATSSALGLSAFALPPTLGTPFDAYSLVEFNTLGSGDVDFGTLRYGNPFPSDWNRVLDGFVGFTRNYLAPGATVPEPLVRGLSTSVLLDPAARDNTQVQLTPGITPPRNPQINGKSLFANQLAVGTSPTLSWQPPAAGVPDYYFVRVLELSAVGTRSQFAQVARLSSAATTMTLPPGILQTGKVYVITIAANKSGTPLTHVNRNGLPFAFATLMSAIVSP
jgi:hypothetical protein